MLSTKTFDKLSKKIIILSFGISRKEEEEENPQKKKTKKTAKNCNKLQYLQSQLKHNDLKKL